ncbi:MAG: hypothetical protein IPL93_12385 [Actinomycetales bacterium]|nr:hypothetical protein [Actinomycetales bacterium]
MRHVEGNIYTQFPVRIIARQNVWLRARHELPDDPIIHAAVLSLYASVYSLEPVLRRHGVLDGQSAASGEPRPCDVVPPDGARRRLDPLHDEQPRPPRAVGGSRSGGWSARTGAHGDARAGRHAAAQRPGMPRPAAGESNDSEQLQPDAQGDAAVDDGV